MIVRPEGAAEVAPDRRAGLRLLLRRSLHLLHWLRAARLQAEEAEDRQDQNQVELHTSIGEQTAQSSEAKEFLLDTELRAKPSQAPAERTLHSNG